MLNTGFKPPAIESMIDSKTHNLLWFRPLSPLNYALPAPLAALKWKSVVHMPMDSLRPVSLSAAEIAKLESAPVWFLSSPTAAHLAAQGFTAQNNALAAKRIAVVGQASLVAWRAAGGFEPSETAISNTGESMGCLPALLGWAAQGMRHVCILRGQAGRPDLIHALRAAGLKVDVISVYEKTPLSPFKPKNSNDTSPSTSVVRSTNQALCFTSSDQVARFLSACDPPEAWLACPYWASHPRIAAQAAALGFTQTILAQSVRLK